MREQRVLLIVGGYDQRSYCASIARAYTTVVDAVDSIEAAIGLLATGRAYDFILLDEYLGIKTQPLTSAAALHGAGNKGRIVVMTQVPRPGLLDSLRRFGVVAQLSCDELTNDWLASQLDGDLLVA